MVFGEDNVTLGSVHTQMSLTVQDLACVTLVPCLLQAKTRLGAIIIIIMCICTIIVLLMLIN